MFDKLEDLLRRFEEIMNELNEPDVANNQERFRRLMKEQSDLTPLVEAYREYKKCSQDVEDSLAMLEEESDEDMREMLKEELSAAKKRIEELEQDMKVLLLPKDPNDDKNVVVELGPQQSKCLGFILQLGLLCLAVHNDSRRIMRQTDCRIRRVDALSTIAGSTHHIDTDIFFIDLYIHFLRFRHYSHRNRRRVNTAAGLCLRHSLHPVHSAFIFHN